MGLSIDVRKIDDILIVAANGPFSTGEGTLFRNTVKRYSDDGARNFILNLGEVSYIDSSGFGELVSLLPTVRNKQGDVKLLNLTAKAKDLLQMTKLLTVFDVYDDESKALAALNASKTSA